MQPPGGGKLFQEVQPDVVINTSALSVPDYCETHHAEADAVNITAVEHLAECCEAGGSRFIHLSTDFVFGGDTDRPYTEEDIPAPVNYYGYTKLEGEKRIAAVCRDYAIRARSGGVRCRPARTAWKCAPTVATD